ncbi:MAG: NACHT domain-containing protein [Verrucomicrobiota bacterium]
MIGSTVGAFILDQTKGILSNFGHALAAGKVEEYQKWLLKGQLPANHHLIVASRTAWVRAVHIVSAQIAKEGSLGTSWWNSFGQFLGSRFSLKDWSKNAALDLSKPTAEWLAELHQQLNTASFEEWHQTQFCNLASLEEMLEADPASPQAGEAVARFLKWIIEGIELGDYNQPPTLAEAFLGTDAGHSLWVLHGVELREILKEGKEEFCAFMVQTGRKLLTEIRKSEHIEPLVAEEIAKTLAAKLSAAEVLQPLIQRMESIVAFVEKYGGKLDRIEQNTNLIPQMQQTLESLVRSPGLDLSHYAKRAIEEFGPVPVADIDGDVGEHVLMLRDVFELPDVRSIGLDEVHIYEVPHEAKAEHDLHHRDDALFRKVWKDRVEKLKAKQENQPVRPVSVVLGDTAARGHIIIGDPGAGKTALLRYLTVIWAGRFLDGEAARDPVPVYVELKRYVEAYSHNRTLDLLDFLHEGCGCVTGMDHAQLKQLLEKDAALLLLDGLDEIIDLQIRSEISRQIRDLFGKGYRVILTSRIYGFQSSEWRDRGWEGWMLQPFTQDQRTRFMEQCHRVFFRNDAERNKRLARLKRKLGDFHHMAELASNPLLLTLLCLINRRSAALPENRTELYESAAKLMIDSWEAQHFGEEGAAMGFDLKPLTLAQKHDILRRIAWRVMRDQHGVSTNLIAEKDLLEVIQDYIKDRPQLGDPERYAECLVQQLRSRSFVLCFAGGEFYSFVHRTFLEFYCAWAWTKHPEADGLALEVLWERLILRRWQEEKWPIIISLAFARLPGDIANQFLERITALVAPAKPCAGLFLAAECLAEVEDRARHQEAARRIKARLLDLAWSAYTIIGTSGQMDAQN